VLLIDGPVSACGPLDEPHQPQVAVVVRVRRSLGGLAELEEREGGLAIRGYGCPLASVTPDHPEACLMVETLIAELTSAAVRERCERGARPRCCFEVALAESTVA
jgi:predicted ArsR family transcriptional regulator